MTVHTVMPWRRLQKVVVDEKPDDDKRSKHRRPYIQSCPGEGPRDLVMMKEENVGHDCTYSHALEEGEEGHCRQGEW
jgi:hypothetical protein